MQHNIRSLTDFLQSLAREAQPGERLPTIRELMQRFSLSQARVQQAFDELKQAGLIESQIGRGTFFVGGAPGTSSATPAAAAPVRRSAVRSVLLLRRSVNIPRGRLLAEGLQHRLVAAGHRVLDVAYSDPVHAQSVLSSLPRFDACVIQSIYRAIPISLLSTLQRTSDVLAVDGTALVGTDVEAVGTEWGEPLAQAVDLLYGQGHRRIACFMSSRPLMATALGWRRFESLQRGLPEGELIRQEVTAVPGEDYMDVLVEVLKGQRVGSSFPFTAMVVWGVDDGRLLRARLEALQIRVPEEVSVVLLGRTDIPQEHDHFFHTVGCQVADQVSLLHQVLQGRWERPGTPSQVHLTPVTFFAGHSVCPPARHVTQGLKGRVSSG